MTTIAGSRNYVVRHLLIMLLILVIGAYGMVRATAQASSIEGHYDVSGTRLDKTAYTGSLTITAAGPVYTLQWEFGQNTTAGVGILHDDVLSATYGNGKCGFASYQIQPDGKLVGLWMGVGKQTPGSETASGNDVKSTDDLPGNYTVTGTNSDGSAYTGTLDIAAAGPVYSFTWN